VTVLIDHRFQRTLLALSGGILGAECIQVAFALFFFFALALDLAANVADARTERGSGLRDGLKFKSNLSALAAEGFNINLSRGGLSLQALRLALQRSDVLFRLDNLVAHLRGRSHGFHHVLPACFLLAF